MRRELRGKGKFKHEFCALHYNERQILASFTKSYDLIILEISQ